MEARLTSAATRQPRRRSFCSSGIQWGIISPLNDQMSPRRLRGGGDIGESVIIYKKHSICCIICQENFDFGFFKNKKSKVPLFFLILRF